MLLDLTSPSLIIHLHSLIIHGPTGVGKSYLASALGREACRKGCRTIIIYCRFLNFIRELTISVEDSSYLKLSAKLAKRDLIIIDDWLRDSVSADQARQIIDILDGRFRS